MTRGTKGRNGGDLLVRDLFGQAVREVDGGKAQEDLRPFGRQKGIMEQAIDATQEKRIKRQAIKNALSKISMRNTQRPLVVIFRIQKSGFIERAGLAVLEEQ